MIKKILIVDDSMLARMAVRKCLSEIPDLEIHEAADGVQGLTKFLEIHPDLTFCDLTMPNMNGFDAMRHMLTASNGAMIVILTADTQQSTSKRLTDGGALMVLHKPPRRDEILRAYALAETRTKAG